MSNSSDKIAEHVIDLLVEQRKKLGLIPEEQLRGFRGMYLETAQRLKAQQDKGSDDPNDPVQQLEFELVLFSSAVIDYDYIMGLIAKSTEDDKPSKHKMSRQQLIDLISSSANLIDERDDIVDYINSLPTDKSINEKEIREGYQAFKSEKSDKELYAIAEEHGVSRESLQAFVDNILNRMIFDGEKLSELLEPLDLGWKARAKAEIALMDELVPLLNKLSQGREISGLAAYE